MQDYAPGEHDLMGDQFGPYSTSVKQPQQLGKQAWDRRRAGLFLSRAEQCFWRKAVKTWRETVTKTEHHPSAP